MAAITLAQLRLSVRYAARNATSSAEYPDSQIDDAIQCAADRWIRATHESAKLTTSTFTVGSNILPAFPSTFTAMQILDTYLTLSGQLINPPITITTYQDVLASQIVQWPWCFPGPYTAQTQTTPPTGQPTLIGFSDTTDAISNYLADKAYVLNLWWWDLFTQWQAGAQGPWSSTTQYQPGDVVSSGGNIYQALLSNLNVAVGTAGTWTNLGAGTVAVPTTLTFNLSDQSLRVLARFGAAGWLQLAEPEKAPQAKDFLAQFDAEAKRFAAMAIGSRGEKVLYKSSPILPDGSWVRGGGYGCNSGGYGNGGY